MPQMMPMNWTMLMISFSLILMIFIMINHFSMKNKMKKNLFKKNKKTIYWKW